METLIVMLAVFGSPVAIIGLVSHYRYKTRQLAAGQAEPDKLLQARCEELEQRIQTLETIVCEGDLDAAAKMRALGKQTDVKRLAPKADER
jgi:Tfp pilus assembly protein PilN